MQLRAENAGVVIQSGKAQAEALRGERAQLAEQAQALARQLAERDAQLQALAKKNGELRWAAGPALLQSLDCSHAAPLAWGDAFVQDAPSRCPA